jgi:two-component system aerobic respiration control sensor histidine kinase ArcB
MSAITLGNIFNDIVDLDKLDRHRLNLVKDRINTQDFMNDLQSLAFIQTEQKKLQLVFEQKTDLPLFIESDDTRLRQVLWNLLTNAVKFTKQGKVSVFCSSYVEDQQTWLCFEIQDTGIGIPKDKLEKIFAMYYQVKGNRHATGTGIGLAVSSKIAKAMNGHFEVTSKLGKGSTFKLYIPVKCLGADPQDSAFQAPPLSVLLVEDIELNVLVARALLEKQGHIVDVAVDGQQAIDKVAKNEYQLILMDIQLPDMDGYEVTRRLRSLHKTLPPIIALTANVFSNPQQFLDKGIDDAVSKPLSLSIFNKMLERHFSNQVVVNKEEGANKPKLIISEPELFNEQMLKELMEFLPISVMLNNVRLFEELMPEYLSILDSHMVAKNQKGIVDKSHKIKGAAASVGLLRIQKLAQKMQSPDLPAWWDNIDDWHELIKKWYLEDIKALKKWIVAHS